MTGFLDYDFSAVPDTATLPQGEYRLRVDGIEQKTSKTSGAPYLSVRLSVPSEPDSENIYHTIMLPVQDGDAKKFNNAIRRLRDFLTACGVDLTPPIAFDRLIGCEFYANLEEEDDAQYGRKNIVKKILTPAR